MYNGYDSNSKYKRLRQMALALVATVCPAECVLCVSSKLMYFFSRMFRVLCMYEHISCTVVATHKMKSSEFKNEKLFLKSTTERHVQIYVWIRSVVTTFSTVRVVAVKPEP
jgi:hypothetical protein